MTAYEFIQKWLSDNVHPDRIHTDGKFDPNTPAIIKKQLLNSAKQEGLTEEEILEADPTLEMTVAQAIMRVVEIHKDAKANKPVRPAS